MPVPRSLVDYIEKANNGANLKVSKISLLNDNRIGIEGFPWLLKLQIKEPFQPTMGGSPLTLNSTIQAELDKLKKYNIKPFFVFPGLNIVKERNAPIKERYKVFNGAWDAYYSGQYEAAEKAFSDSEKTQLVLPFIHSIVSYFKQQSIEFFKAPFSSPAQLAFFSDPSQKNYLNAVWGGYELLLFGVNRLIVDIDYDKGQFYWVDLKAILNEFGLTHDQFVDACLLCGFEFCPALPILHQIGGPNQSPFKAACELVRQYQTGIAVIQDHFNAFPMSEKYMEQFMKTKCLIRNHMVFTPSCVCEPLYRDLTYQVKPTDLNSIFGPKLPNDLYFYISQGVISPQVVNNLISGTLLEPQPTVETEEFKRMLEYLKDVRAKTLGLVSNCLSDDITNKQVKNIRWFEPKEIDIPHSSILSNGSQATAFGKLNKSLSIPLDTKNQLQTLIKSNKPITFQFVANCCVSNPPSSTLNDDGTIVPIKDLNEARFYVLYHSLSLMGYIGNDNKLTQYGKLLQTLKNSKFQEEIILAIELIRSGCITSEKLSFIPKPTFENMIPPSTATISLLSRLLSLLPCKLDNGPWEAPVDHDLMGFHEITKTLYKSLRNLVELTALSHFLTHRIVFEPNQYFDFSVSLPFFLQPNASTGLMVKGMLLEGMMIDKIEEIFPNCVAVKQDLELASEFIKEIMTILPLLLKDQLIDKSLYDVFVEADKLWNDLRKRQLELL